MSRFYLIGAQECIVGTMRRRLKAGVTVADTSGNAQAGDFISAQLCASPNVRMVPLDASAVTAFANVGIVARIGVPLSGPPGSGDSIDA